MTFYLDTLIRQPRPRLHNQRAGQSFGMDSVRVGLSVVAGNIVTFASRVYVVCGMGHTGTGNRSFSEKTVKKNQLRHKIHTTESDFESFMEDNGRGQCTGWKTPFYH